jgi:hypothetical protein
MIQTLSIEAKSVLGIFSDFAQTKRAVLKPESTLNFQRPPVWNVNRLAPEEAPNAQTA